MLGSLATVVCFSAALLAAASAPNGTSVSTATEAEASTVPLSVILLSKISGVSDFFPFHDITTLGTSKNDSFSFKELFEDGIEGSQEIKLFRSGCQVDGQADCPRACGDRSLFFGSLETFYNCAALASVAHGPRHSNDYFISAEAERNASSIMGTGTLAGFNGTSILSSFISCAQAACDSDGLHSPCSRSIKALSINTSTAEEIFDAMDTFCPEIQAEINPDIFGPGVLISYALQVCFSSLLYLFLKGFNLWVGRPQKRAKEFTLSRVQTLIWRDSSAVSRTSVAISTTLVEFQEAQCWFVFAVQIASILAIVVNSQEGTFWGEIIVNAAIAYHISQNGILPMFLVQICLHNEGIRNWHTFLGFFVEYLLAIVATTQKISFKSAFELFRGQTEIEACGNNPSPRTYCAATHGVDGLQLGFFPHPLLYKMVFLILDTVAIVVLVIDQLAWTLRNHQRTKHIRIYGHRLGRWPQGRFKPHWRRFKSWFWWTLELLYLVVNLLYLASLIRIIRGNSFAPNRWSYGQIIAMTVWGPVIVKMVDLIISGPPKNGGGLSSGPPRLRLDNLINHRFGTSVDETSESEPNTPRPRTISFAPDQPRRTRHDIEGAVEDEQDAASDIRTEVLTADSDEPWQLKNRRTVSTA